MEKWIKVHGKKMDSIEFTRFIREKTAQKIGKKLKSKKLKKRSKS